MSDVPPADTAAFMREKMDKMTPIWNGMNRFNAAGKSVVDPIPFVNVGFISNRDVKFRTQELKVSLSFSNSLLLFTCARARKPYQRHLSNWEKNERTDAADFPMSASPAHSRSRGGAP